MISSISGQIEKVGSDHLIISVGGVGLRVAVPGNVISGSNVAPGRTIRLSTHLLVRETDLSLFGFPSDDDLKLFETLIAVSGVGPKVAMAILSTLSPELLKRAISTQESAILQRVPGIGKKTAERIMFHLKDKLDLDSSKGAVSFMSDVDGDVLQLLTTLGFSVVEAQMAIQRLPREVTGLDERVQLALQVLDPHGSAPFQG